MHLRCDMLDFVSVFRHDDLTLNLSCTVCGLSILNDKLFVGCCYDTQVKVFDLSTLSLLRNLSIPALGCVGDMTSCPQCDVVYIADWLNGMIHVIDECGLRVQWKEVPRQELEPWGLSVNSQRNFVVTLPFSRKLREYTPSGQLVRQITTPSGKDPSVAIQLDNDRFVAVDACCLIGSGPGLGVGLYIIYITNDIGTVIESFIRHKTSYYGVTCHRVRLLLIGDSLIVTNEEHDRLLLFNVSPLTFVRELTEIDSGSYKNAVSSNDTRLFVSVGREIRVLDIVWV